MPDALKQRMRESARFPIGKPSSALRIGSDAAWILERGATVYEKRICTSLPSSLRIAWNERDVGISFETGALFIRYWLMATPSLP
jgi:hypothetical protein